MRLAVYQPDIPQNLGTLFRLAACMGIAIDIIEPCGFPFDDRKLRRAGMDYIDHVDFTRHSSWGKFKEFISNLPASRLILLTTKTTGSYIDFTFQEQDILLVGKETAGVPDEVASACNAKVTIPMKPPMRSLNVAVSASMVLGEALRQAALFP
jgi:tRNA (cytidine/uridine-2'-O-)-methyltransferase